MLGDFWLSGLSLQLKGKRTWYCGDPTGDYENLIDRGYILQDQKVLKPTQKGVERIRLIKERLPQAQLLISAAKMRWGRDRSAKGVRLRKLAKRMWLCALEDSHLR